MRLWSMNWKDRWCAILLIQRRDLQAMVYGLGIYFTLFLSLLVSSLLIKNNLGLASKRGVLVMTRPLYLPFFLTAVLSSLYLAVSSATSISRERDQGTLEVLFYGPLDYISFILGKYMSQMVIYLLIISINILCLALYALLFNMAFSGELVWAALLSLFTTSSVVAFGMLLSTFTGRVRTSLFLFLGVVLVFLAIQGGYQIVSGFSIETRPGRVNPLLFIREALAFLNRLTLWLSPFSYLSRGMDALTVGNLGAYLGLLLLSALSTALLLFACIVALERKGVRR